MSYENKVMLTKQLNFMLSERKSPDMVFKLTISSPEWDEALLQCTNFKSFALKYGSEYKSTITI